MKIKNILAGIVAAAVLAVTPTAAFAEDTSAAVSGFETKSPDVFISTDYKPGYTSVGFVVPEDKFSIFSSEDDALLHMAVWFGDFSEERDEDVELPMAAYHITFNLVDPAGGEDNLFVYTFVEDNGEPLAEMVEEFVTEDGGYAVAVCFNDADPYSEDIASEARNAGQLRIFYSIQNKNGKYIDGSWEDYTVKMLKTDISGLTFGRISAKRCTGEEIKPNIVVKDGGRKLVKDRDYTVDYRYNYNPGTADVIVTGIGDYTGTKRLTFKIVLGKVKLSATSARNRAKLTWTESTGADGYQIYYSENGAKYRRLTTVRKLSCAAKYSVGSTVKFKVRPYFKSDGVTYYGAWSNVVTVK